MEQRHGASLTNSDHSSNRRSEGHENRHDTPPRTVAEDREYYKTFLEQLLDLVCNNDQADVARMVSIIRSGASQEDIRTALSEVQGKNNHAGQNGHAEPYDINKNGSK